MALHAIVSSPGIVLTRVMMRCQRGWRAVVPSSDSTTGPLRKGLAAFIERALPPVPPPTCSFQRLMGSINNISSISSIGSSSCATGSGAASR